MANQKLVLEWVGAARQHHLFVEHQLTVFIKDEALCLTTAFVITMLDWHHIGMMQVTRSYQSLNQVRTTI